MAMQFLKCPSCGNVSEGYTVFQCENCGGFWCHKSGFLSSSGCGAASNHCPHCSERKKVGFLSSNFKTAGWIGQG